ncbi:hypothetical protein B7G54_06245 [Burkholderia puraquae]|uniref:Uncharacterized protein n=1 Tax=Burkholderia puraquae TaxID=1904757 RepID=A0A1X1PML5_9BURK|nr:hypothetical protein [Burkholderia puraquae]ORT88201.1 hypothetical protein B7G54_06245 [Burkholderia puraquae]CAB3750455.1 hypothetical protein LMG29660_01289 [Burkholderia puraquae]
MTSQSRQFSLPGAAALIAAVITTAQFLLGLYVWSTKSSPSVTMLAVQLSSFFGGLVFRTGLVFLIVRWHGEKRDQLAFRRPALPLTAYALCLLVWQAAQILIFQALVAMLSSGALSLAHIGTIIAPLNAVLYALVAWLAWWLVTHLFRHDALPGAPRGNARRRIAGLAAWLFVSALQLFMPQAVMMLLDYYDDGLKLVMLNYVGGVVLCAAVVFAGAMFGLPRDLGRLHVRRMVGASLASVVSVLLLAYGVLRVLGNVLGTVSLMSGMMPIVVLAGIGVAYWVWFRVFYAGARREIAEAS